MTKRSLLLIVLGIAIGASMGFAGFYPPATPSNITFKVLRTGKVYLDPQAGDIITWKNESGTAVKVSFPLASPCNEASPTATCTVKTPVPTGVFDYICKDSGGGVTCTDPGIDPDPGGGGLGPLTAPGPSVSGLTTSTQVVGLQVGCDSGGNVTVVDANSASPPTIKGGAIIQWTSPGQTFTIAGASLAGAAGACASSSLGSSGNAVQWCASKSGPATVSYTATVLACTGTKTKTFTLSLN